MSGGVKRKGEIKKLEATFALYYALARSRISLLRSTTKLIFGLKTYLVKLLPRTGAPTMYVARHKTIYNATSGTKLLTLNYASFQGYKEQRRQTL